jgi:hypothetical protein
MPRYLLTVELTPWGYFNPFHTVDERADLAAKAAGKHAVTGPNGDKDVKKYRQVLDDGTFTWTVEGSDKHVDDMITDWESYDNVQVTNKVRILTSDESAERARERAHRVDKFWQAIFKRYK